MNENEAVWSEIYRFLNREIVLADFEQWVYATPELEDVLGETVYFELIAANYKHHHALHTIRKLLDEQVDDNVMNQWLITRSLQQFVDGVGDKVEHIATFYDVYRAGGANFLSPLALVYITSSICDLDIELSVYYTPKMKAELDAEVDRLYPQMVQTAKEILGALRHGTLYFNRS